MRANSVIKGQLEGLEAVAPGHFNAQISGWKVGIPQKIYSKLCGNLGKTVVVARLTTLYFAEVL